MREFSKEEMLKLFEDVNSTLHTAKTKELRAAAGKVTITDILRKNGVELQLPEALKATLKQALEADLNADPNLKHPACAACCGCCTCAFCAEVNFGVALVGLVGTVGFAAS